MFYIGTSGYVYADWVETFYPRDLKRDGWLSFYAQHFNALEINFTYYRMPTAQTLEGMARQVPADFLFSIKATQEMTHTREADAALFPQFRQALTPLIDANKFGAVLAQFPFSFHATQENLDYMKKFRAQLRDVPIVIEFRSRDWLTDKTFAFLREQELAFCCVDEPPLKGLLPPIAESTSDIAYVRFHGRNAQKWWEHAQAYERYDYSYSSEELAEWIPKIKKLNASAQKTFLFANNHYRAQGVQTARQLRLMLET